MYSKERLQKLAGLNEMKINHKKLELYVLSYGYGDYIQFYSKPILDIYKEIEDELNLKGINPMDELEKSDVENEYFKLINKNISNILKHSNSIAKLLKSILPDINIETYTQSEGGYNQFPGPYISYADITSRLFIDDLGAALESEGIYIKNGITFYPKSKVFGFYKLNLIYNVDNYN